MIRFIFLARLLAVDMHLVVACHSLSLRGVDVLTNHPKFFHNLSTLGVLISPQRDSLIEPILRPAVPTKAHINWSTQLLSGSFHTFSAAFLQPQDCGMMY